MDLSDVALVCSSSSNSNVGMALLRVKKAISRMYDIMQEAYAD